MTTAVAEPTSIACERFISAGSAKNSMNTKMIAAARSRTIQSVDGDDTRCAVDAIPPRFLAIRRLIQPLRECRLLGECRRLGGSDRAEQRDAPRVDRVAELARLHERPLLLDDRSAVARELAREPIPRRGREELRGLVLLDDEERFGLGSGSRLVVGGEGQEDHEAGEDREAAGEDAEDAGRPVSVREEAPLGSAPPNEEHRGDRARNGDDDDDRRPREGSRRITRVVLLGWSVRRVSMRETMPCGQEEAEAQRAAALAPRGPGRRGECLPRRA